MFDYNKNLLKHCSLLILNEHTSDLIHTQSQVFNAFSGSFLCQKAGWYRFGNLIMIVETKQGQQRGRVHETKDGMQLVEKMWAEK